MISWYKNTCTIVGEDAARDELFIVSQVEVFDVHHIFSKYSSGSIVPKEQLSCNYFKLSDAHEGVGLLYL